MTAVDSPEKALFISTTQSFLQKEAPLSRVRELHAAGASFDPAWWRRAAELGWTGLLVPEELGGGSVSENGLADLATVAELLGKTVAPGPLYPVSVVLTALAESAEARAHAGVIESLISGETVASWAVAEPGRGWDPLHPAVTATATAAGYRIDGIKDRVEAGAQSGLLLVVTRCGADVRQFLYRLTPRACGSSPSSRWIWSSSTRACISTGWWWTRPRPSAARPRPPR